MMVQLQVRVGLLKVAIDKVDFPRGPNTNAGAADRFLYLVGMYPGIDISTSTEHVNRVDIPETPTGSINNIDKYLLAVGIWPGIYTVTESERIDLPEAPTGLINTVDRYMFLLGMYPGATEVEVAANGAVILNNLVLSGVVI